jgi:hypothetical protein
MKLYKFIILKYHFIGSSEQFAVKVKSHASVASNVSVSPFFFVSNPTKRISSL